MKIGVLGVGKLGLCFALNLEHAGFEVVAIDVDETYVKQLNSKEFISAEPLVTDWLKVARHFKASTEIADVLADGFDLLFIMVATPATEDGSYSHQQIERVAEGLKQFGARKNKVHLVVVCTTMPGYCDLLGAEMEPYNYTVTYNPEFIAQGSIIYDQQNPSHILIGGSDSESAALVSSVLCKVATNSPPVNYMSRLSAEICKLATNCFLTTKISFANSIGDLAVRAGAEPEKILAAIGADKRIGKSYLNYGFGYGGPCFPRDNRAFTAFAASINVELPLSAATDKVNKEHLEFQFKEYMRIYNADDVIVFTSVTYKAGTVILDESQPLALALKLALAGRKVLIKEAREVVETLRKIYGDAFMYETKP